MDLVGVSHERRGRRIGDDRACLEGDRFVGSIVFVVFVVVVGFGCEFELGDGMLGVVFVGVMMRMLRMLRMKKKKLNWRGVVDGSGGLQAIHL